MLNDFGVFSTCKNWTLGRKPAPESVKKRPRVQLTPGRPPDEAEIYPVEERVSPEGSVFTSPSWVCMHRSARPYLHLLSSLDENIFFLLSWLFLAIRIEHRFRATFVNMRKVWIKMVEESKIKKPYKCISLTSRYHTLFQC